MYGTLLFVSNKKYKKDKVLEILQKHCYDADIPETVFGKLNSDIVMERFNAAKPPKFLELMTEKKYRETKNEKYAKRLEEYHALRYGDVERYYNMQSDFSVKKGKVYTTKNILGGKYTSIGFPTDKVLYSKKGNYVDVCKKEEMSENSYDIFSMFFDYDNNKWIKLKQALVVADGEDFDYQEALKEARKAKRIRKKMHDTIKDLDGARYCYGLIYEQ